MGVIGRCLAVALWVMGWPISSAARVTAPRPLTAASALADTVVTTPLGPDAGEVDWTHRVLRVRAHGAPPVYAFVPSLGLPYALRRASSMAQAKLHTLLRAMPIGPGAEVPLAAGTTVGDILGGAPQLLALAQASTEAMQTTDSTFAADGTVELEVTLRLDGGRGTPGPLWAALWQLLRPQAPSPEVAQAQAQTPWGGAAPSGVVIVARGAPVAPALWPRLCDEAGRTLYGPARMHPDMMQIMGPWGIARSLEAALRDPRVAEHAVVLPARVPVATPGGGAMPTAVLALEQAAQLAALGPLLAEGRVMLVVDDLAEPPFLLDATDLDKR